MSFGHPRLTRKVLKNMTISIFQKKDQTPPTYSLTLCGIIPDESPLCDSQWTKRVVCVQKFICLNVFLFTYVYMRHSVHVTCAHIFLRIHTRKSSKSTDPSDFFGFVTRPLWVRFYGRGNPKRVRGCVQPEDEVDRHQMCRKISFLTISLRFEKQSFPISFWSKSCNSVISYPCTV